MTNLPDIPRFYTAIAEWGACLLYIIILRKRIKPLQLVFVAGAFLLVQSLFLVFTGDVPLAWWIPCMVGAIALMWAFIFATCDVSIADAVYVCARAFVLAELIASLQWQLYLFAYPQNNAPIFISFIAMVLVYGIAGVIVYLLESRQPYNGTRLNIQPRELWGAVLIGIVVFAISNMSFVAVDVPFKGQSPLDILNVRTLVDIGGYAMLYAYHVQCCQTRRTRELEAVQNILQNQYIQYQQSRESIELINRKYHDLKHQITALRAEQDDVKRNAYLDQMENEIKTYEAQNKTGNPVLDVVLTGKSLYCQKHGITLTCVADGTLMQFMNVVDLCTIFGNALDNAIESVKKVNDKERRLIHLTLTQQKNFVLVRVENYFEGALTFDDGLPLTTKNNQQNHGYGLKSIRLVAQKYGGVTTITTNNAWFELKILFPQLQ